MIDIIIPLYNEEKILAKSVETIIDFFAKTDFPHPYRITLANNASTDRSLEVSEQLARIYPEHVSVCDIGSKGKGLAVRTAWQKSRGDTLAFMDADLSSDLRDFRPLVEAVTLGGNDMAIGNRLGKSSTLISDKVLRRFASRVYNMAVRTFLDSHFDDHQCGFKVMKKNSFDKIAPHLVENGFFFDTELVAIALAHGMKVKSVDILWRDSSQSKVSLFRDSMKMFIDILRLRGRLNKISIK